VAVIGGGPAGMMAAGRAAELGAKVVLIDKNKNLGRKLLITGKGRCNITHAEFDGKEFVKELGKNGKFIFSSLSAFGPQDVIKFFEEKGLKTKIERGRRVFPVSDKAMDVLSVLSEYLKKNNVKIIFGQEVLGFNIKDKKITGIRLKNEIINSDKFILAVGGKSHPLTGSTGDGYSFAKEMGHGIIEASPSLVPIKIKEDWAKDLQGLSLKNIAINIFQNNKKQDSRFGEMLFTHFGLSGPIILDASKKIGELLKDGKVEIRIDLKPALDFLQLDKRLQRDFEGSRKKDFKNYLPELLPQKLIETFLKLSGIDPHKKLHFVTKQERKNILHLLKEMKMTASGLLGFDQAIVTSGGVSLSEVDSKTMKSKIISNLFFAGEILDLDGPTGGYNLQISWSTGYAAGTYASGK
ncbi:MAG: NAD(P)/FAD-dependent oxidoreductase, partial [bacterium]